MGAFENGRRSELSCNGGCPRILIYSKWQNNQVTLDGMERRHFCMIVDTAPFIFATVVDHVLRSTIMETGEEVGLEEDVTTAVPKKEMCKNLTWGEDQVPA